MFTGRKAMLWKIISQQQKIISLLYDAVVKKWC